MSKQVIIGLAGGGKTNRREMVKVFMALMDGKSKDITVSKCWRTPWGRAERLDSAIAATDCPVLVAGINCLEEAMTIEDAGGIVIHVDGPPSEEISIARDSLLVTAKEPRGRYLSPGDALQRAMVRCGGCR